MARRKNYTPSEKLAFPSTLKAAWRQIRSNGLSSASKDTLKAIREFELSEDKLLNRLASKLRQGTYQFPPALAIIQRKTSSDGKKKERPLVLADVESRIVQRALLDVLQEISGIRAYLEIPTSFGGIQKRGVPLAIAAATTAIHDGATHYFKSDIKQFFTQIPRKEVVEKIARIVGDQKFVTLLDGATNLEISNLGSIPAELQHFFDFDSIGTPQGCCLSPLFGNILLSDFDTMMNSGDIRCLRYLDDFIIFGPNERAVRAAFKRALTKLKEYGLDAYQPETDPKKASVGDTKRTFEYLGVEIQGSKLRPSQDSVKRLLSAVDAMLTSAKRFGKSEPPAHPDETSSLIGVFQRVHNKLKGWGNQYYFCNDAGSMAQIDKQIDRMIDEFRSNYAKRQRLIEERSDKSLNYSRRLLGVHLLTDSN